MNSLSFFSGRVLFIVVFSMAVMLAPQSFAGSGEEKYKTFIAQTPIVDDVELTEYVNAVGQRLAAKSNNPNIKYTFTVLDSPGLNAFAHEGGYVYIYRGLMGYMRNEAELAAVLAHEIGHVTEKHISRQSRGNISGQILAMLAGVLSGSQEVYEAGMLLSSSLIRGYGRDMELEADLAGAQTMARAGYDPQDMIGMLSTMKDYETLKKKKAADKGGGNQTYHGLFSTHPRNDARLRTVVTEAEKLSKSVPTIRDSGTEIYRQKTQGMVWGENFIAKEKKQHRYSNMQHRVRFDFPEDWQWKELLNVVKGSDKEEAATLTMEAMPRTVQSPEEFMHNHLQVGEVKEGKVISPVRLKGYSAIIPAKEDKPPQRIAVIYYKLKAYVFVGQVADPKTFEEYDKIFNKSINTFRTITQREIDGEKPKAIHYVKATEHTSFAALAKSLDLGPYGEDELRLMNGYYPTGKPDVGEWIKIVR